MLLKNGNVYTPFGFKKADVSVCDGIITSVCFNICDDGFDSVFNIDGLYLLPAFADVHVHLREPGFSYKETIKSGTEAAAKAGYSLLCSMPNLSPVPDTLPHLREQLDIISRDAAVEVLPFASITIGQKGKELVDFDSLAPFVAGFSDDGKGVQGSAVMRKAQEEAARLGKLISAHCEDEELLRGGYIHDGAYAKSHGHRGICSESEWGQLLRDIELVRQTNCRYHACHISAKESVELIRKAKREGLPVSCETAPHYLTLCDEDLQEDGRFKMNPPLRSREDKAALIEGLLDGTIDVIATDHAPHSFEEKSRGLELSNMGITGLETAFPVLYTELVETGVITLERLTELMSINPRKLLSREFGIEEGKQADFAVVDLNTEYTIDSSSFLSKGRATPFEGKRVRGVNTMTVCGGKVVYSR